MDPSPTPPRRFSHWKTTKRTFTFGKSVGDKPKTLKSPNKPSKNSVNINKSLQKIPEILVNEAIDQFEQSHNNTNSKNSSETKKKKLTIDEANVILEKSKDSDRGDSVETSSVDKENKDLYKQKRKGRKVKASLTSQSTTNNTSKRKHSLGSLDDSVINSEQLTTLQSKQVGVVHTSQVSDSESESCRAKQIKKNKEVDTQSQEFNNATNRSKNSANSSNAAIKSTNAIHRSTKDDNSSYANKSTDAGNRNTKAVNRSNAANKSPNAVNTSNAAIKNSNAANISHNAINGSNNSSNRTFNRFSLETNNNASSDSKILSTPIVSPNKLVLGESNSRPSLRNRSLLLSSKEMQQKRQYPLSYYSKKQSDKSIDSNTSRDFKTSKTKTVNLSKSKESFSKNKNETLKCKDNISKSKSKNTISKNKDTISKNKDSMSKSNEEKHAQIDSEQRQNKMSVPEEMIQLSKKGQLVVHKSISNLRRVSPSALEDNSVRPKEENAHRKTSSKLDNETLNGTNKRLSKEPKEISGESNCTDSQSEIKKHNIKRKAQLKNQGFPENQHSPVKKLKSSKAPEAVGERKSKSVGNVESSRLSPSDHPSGKTTSPTLKPRPAGLRNSNLLLLPTSKQYPISYYYSDRHQPDQSSDKETSRPQKSGQTVNAIEGPVHSKRSSTAEVNVDLPAKHERPKLKTRKLKAGKVSSSDPIVISKHLMRNVTIDQDFDLDIIDPEPQIATKEVTRKKAASLLPVKSKPLLKAGQSKSQDLSQNETVVASQTKQRKRNLAKEFDASQKRNDVSKSKKRQSRQVHVWCEDGKSRRGSDITAYDVLLENLDAMEQRLKEDEVDMNSKEMITKVMDDFRSQIQSLLLKRLDLKGLKRDIRKVKARCSKLKKDISKKQKENFELSSQMGEVQKQSKDVNLLLASCWMKDYARLMEALDNLHA